MKGQRAVLGESACRSIPFVESISTIRLAGFMVALSLQVATPLLLRPTIVV